MSSNLKRKVEEIYFFSKIYQRAGGGAEGKGDNPKQTP